LSTRSSNEPNVPAGWAPNVEVEAEQLPDAPPLVAARVVVDEFIGCNHWTCQSARIVRLVPHEFARLGDAGPPEGRGTTSIGSISANAASKINWVTLAKNVVTSPFGLLDRGGGQP
jgi:hypothetical protein